MENILDKELSENLKLKELIVYYNQIRPVSKYSEICHIICTIHNRSISVRQLKHFCQKLKLTRRCHVQDDLVKDIITNELSTSRSCLGYRQLSEFVNIKACVRYFHQIFIFSPYDSPSKTMKNAFISSIKLFSFSRYSKFRISSLPSFLNCRPLL